MKKWCISVGSLDDVQLEFRQRKDGLVEFEVFTEKAFTIEETFILSEAIHKMYGEIGISQVFKDEDQCSLVLKLSDKNLFKKLVSRDEGVVLGHPAISSVTFYKDSSYCLIEGAFFDISRVSHYEGVEQSFIMSQIVKN